VHISTKTNGGKMCRLAERNKKERPMEMLEQNEKENSKLTKISKKK
jgi:hypothetical protein